MSTLAPPLRSERRRVLSGRRLTTVLGWISLASLALLTWLGLDVAPPDAVQGDAARLMYVHVPAAWLAYLAFTVSAICSLLYLWPRTRSLSYDRLAGSSAEVGVVFCGLTLVLGSIWGKPIWGTWWVWDARLVTTAVLFFLYLGYLALRRVPDDPHVRARRCGHRRARGGRRHPDRPLLGQLVADAAPGRHGLQPRPRRPDQRHHGLDAAVGRGGLHACSTPTSC